MPHKEGRIENAVAKDSRWIVHRSGGQSAVLQQGPVCDQYLPGPLLLCLWGAAQLEAVNNEHVIPEWVLRKFNLFDRALTLANGMTVKYGRYKVPCCEDCNSLMGLPIEERISKVVNAGPDAVQRHIANGNGLRTGTFGSTSIAACQMTRSGISMTGKRYITCIASSDTSSTARTSKRKCSDRLAPLRQRAITPATNSTTATCMTRRRCWDRRCCLGHHLQ